MLLVINENMGLCLYILMELNNSVVDIKILYECSFGKLKRLIIVEKVLYTLSFPLLTN